MLDYNLQTLYTKKALKFYDSYQICWPFNTVPHFYLKMLGLYYYTLIIGHWQYVEYKK